MISRNINLMEQNMTEKTEEVSLESVLARYDKAQLVLEQKQAEFAQYLDEVQKHQNLVAEIKNELYERMSAENVERVENDHFVVSLTAPYKRHNYDMKQLKAINPSLFEQVDAMVGKDTIVKGSVKITIKEV